MSNLNGQFKPVDSTADTATTNACKVCSPLGSSVVFKGIRGCIPMIHGSQGCATYIRRYLISHYKEPVDIASSNFSQESTIFGGNKNFITGIDNIIRQYHPEAIAISSSCLSETIGEDVKMLIHEYKEANKGKELPAFIYASTPSYQGTHIDGFHEAVLATVAALAQKDSRSEHINLFSGFISPQDLRYLKETLSDFGLQAIILPDYSDTLDGANWSEYQLIPQGGVPVATLARTGSAKASIEFGYAMNKGKIKGRIKEQGISPTAAEYLQTNFGVRKISLGMPIGIKETDKFFEQLQQLSGKDIPEKHVQERGRLVDSYIDGHKYVFGKRAVIYGDEDFLIGMASFLSEIGIIPVLCASGGESGMMKEIVPKLYPGAEIDVCEGVDFEEIANKAEALKPDIIIGSSKGYYFSRKLGIPIVRVGFPIHDRMGGQRLLHLGYRGTQELFDKITNALIEYKQDNSPVGYKYM